MLTGKNLKIIGWGLAALAVIGVWLYVGRLQDRAELALRRAETAEGLAAGLIEANARLKAAQAACNLAAAAQGIAASAAALRRDTLDEIMTRAEGPGPNSAEAAQIAEVNPPLKGEPLNDIQSRKLVDFYNRDIFGGLRPR
ncbi:hypothetical protein FACS189460_3130 [Deltaproteobacteria bacterium]|nr:hypothetical protein FACS189460_3130 [Deltaproteobacteria bacterium]